MTLQSIAQVNVGFGFLVCVNFGCVVAMLIGNQYDLLNCSWKNVLHTAMFSAGQLSELKYLIECCIGIDKLSVASRLHFNLNFLTVNSNEITSCSMTTPMFTTLPKRKWTI